MARLPSAADLMGGRPRVGVQGGVNAAQPGAVPNLGDGGAAGLMEVGRALVSVGSDLDRVFKAEQERTDKLRAEDSFNQLREQQLDLSLGEKNGFAQTKGGDAANGDLLKKWTARFDDLQRKIEGTLENDRQREAFKQRAAVARSGFQGDIFRHVAKETDVYALSVYKGTLDVETRNAMANWEDAPAIATSGARIKNAVAAEAERSGWSPEARTAAQMSALSGMHSAVITQALANNNPAYAQEYYKTNKAELDPNVSKTLAHAVSDGAQKQLADGFQARYIAGRNDQRQLDALETEVAKSPLDEDRKNILVGRIAGRRDTLEIRTAAAYERRLRTIQGQINGVNRITLAGYEPNAEQMLTVLSAAKGTELEPEVRNMMAVANATKEFRNAPPQQQEATITALEREARKDPTKFDVTVVQRFKTIHESQRAAARDDPINFAVRQGFVEQEDPAVQPLNLAEPAALGDALHARLTVARGVAAKYGTLVKPLTTEERDMLTSMLRKASPTDKQNYFGGLANALGNDFDGYKAVMAQVAPDDTVTAHAGIMAGRGRMATYTGQELEPGQANNVATLILQGQAVLHPNRKEDGSPEKGKLWPMPPEKDMDMLFKDYERDAFAGNAAARNGFYQTAKAIYAARSVEAGDSSGALDSARWDEAMRLSTGGIARVNGRSVVLPWGMNEGQFKDQLTRRIEDVAASGRLAEGVAERLKDTPLRATGDGMYLFQAGDGIVVDKNNRPVIMDFNQSPAFRSSGYGKPSPTATDTRTQWMTATGGVLRVGENEPQAIQRWLQGEARTLGGINTAKPQRAPTPVLPSPGTAGVRG